VAVRRRGGHRCKLIDRAQDNRAQQLGDDAAVLRSPRREQTRGGGAAAYDPLWLHELIESVSGLGQFWGDAP